MVLGVNDFCGDAVDSDNWQVIVLKLFQKKKLSENNCEIQSAPEINNIVFVSIYLLLFLWVLTFAKIIAPAHVISISTEWQLW